MPGKDMPWGGRFASGPHPEMMRLSSSIDVDIRLLAQDVRATAAHARALGRAGLLDESEIAEIGRELDRILTDYGSGAFEPVGDEDVHSSVERVLSERLGDLGARIHAGRSRNDLVATDLRLWCKGEAGALAAATAELIETLCDVASEHLDSVMPGFTHLQRAQPVSLGFHLVAHATALVRDGDRFLGARKNADECALGAGALAGSTLRLDPVETARDLGFARTFSNAMDAVANRDFAVDLVYACALCGVTLSRLAEEIVLWTSAEFSFARLADKWSTGSSMMPQKRNPDLAELVRGRAASGIGDLTSILALVKGLPLAYDRDLQEDKGLVFAAVDRTHGSLTGMGHLLRSLVFDRDRLAAAARAGSAWATDVAEILVTRGVPFRDAHAAVGRLVADLEERGASLAEMSAEDLAAHHPALRPEDAQVTDPRRGLEARSGPGGPAPVRVAEQVESLRAAAARLADGG